MLREPQLDKPAAWKQHFRAAVIASARIARLDPTRGLVVSNRSGVYQLQQLTSKPEGMPFGVISRDGRYTSALRLLSSFLFGL